MEPERIRSQRAEKLCCQAERIEDVSVWVIIWHYLYTATVNP